MMDLLGWEKWKNWHEQFEQSHVNSWTQAEILERVRRLERLHWSWCILGIVLTTVGAGLAPFQAGAGCMLVIVGSVLVIGTKLASSNALCTYHILWDIRRRDDEAVRNSEIQDL